jgi:hypothetical protein
LLISTGIAFVAAAEVAQVAIGVSSIVLYDLSLLFSGSHPSTFGFPKAHSVCHLEFPLADQNCSPPELAAPTVFPRTDPDERLLAHPVLISDDWRQSEHHLSGV